MKKTAQGVTYFPQYAEAHIKRTTDYINAQLSNLQTCVEAHGETWADVQTYVSRGADYHVNERLAECRAHLDKLGTPAYLRADAEQRAVDDLGAENVQYWKELARLLVIRESPTDTQPLSLLDITDASGERWHVKQAWVDAKRKDFIVHVPQWVVDDFNLLQTANKALAKINASGYDLSEFYLWLERGAEANIDIQWFFNIYNSKYDKVHADLGQHIDD